MSDLGGRRIVVYVGGSIAAYKSGDVVTGLRKRGAEVRVAMTPGAQQFITAETLHALSGNPVATDVFVPVHAAHGMEHLGLAEWAELQCAVAASANLIARLALGLADDAVTTTALASTAPLIIAPAMETAMWEHPATAGHVETLIARGALLVGPSSGRLASGREGFGRMAEPAEIIEAVVTCLKPPRGA